MSKIAVLGSSSSIAQSLFNYFQNIEDAQVIWVGRNKPSWLTESLKNRFIQFEWQAENLKMIDPVLECDTILFIGAKFQNKLLLNTDEVEIFEIVNSILLLPMKVISKTLKSMIHKKKGHFIFFGSSVADRGVTGSSIYGTSKSALKYLVQNLALEYGKFGIRSNVIQVGNIGSGMAKLLDDKNTNAILARTSNKKVTPVEDIILAIDFLLKNESINGESIKVDGGYF